MKASKKTVKGIVFFTVILVIALIGIGFALDMDVFGNDDDSEASTAESSSGQSIEVQRGSLITTISAFGNVSMPHQVNLVFGIGGTVEELNTNFGNSVKEGDTLSKLDTASLERSVARAEADLRTAQISLEKASSDVNIVQAEAAVESAQTTLVSAEEALEQARNFSVSDAETNLENAQRNLDTAQKNAEINIRDAQEAVDAAFQTYNLFVNNNRENLGIGSIQAQKDDLWWAYEKALENQEIDEEANATAIATAEANVTTAENALSNAPINIQQKESAVATAEAALIQAENDLTYVQAGLDIELLQIIVDKAQIALDEAQNQLEKATIIAPFDGTIARVNIVIGDEVMANTIAMQLVDTTKVEIDADVDEIDVAKLEIGQNAEIDLDALQGTILNGAVTAVSPVGLNQSGLITYDLTVEILDAAGFNLKDGMTASVDIEAIIAHNAILIPKVAITRDRAAGIQIVTVVADNNEEEVREVQTGASNGKLTEIITGLEEGEHIISSVSIAVSQGSGGSSSSDSAGCEDVDITECMAKVQDIMSCTEALTKFGEETGSDASEFDGEIPWDLIEDAVNDDTGEVSKDIKKCLNVLLENRCCLEALTQMAEDMGIDTSQYSGGMGGM